MTGPRVQTAPMALGTTVIAAAALMPGIRALLGGWGAAGVALVLVVACALALVRRRGELPTWTRTPKALAFLLAAAVLSLAWSWTDGAAAFADASSVVAVLVGASVAGGLLALLPWSSLVAAIGRAMRGVVAVSLLFELVAAIVVRAPIADVDGATFSASALVTGGPIQGVAGSATALGSAALLGLVVLLLERAGGSIGPRGASVWIVVLLATVLLTRSPAVTVALLAVAVVAGFAVWARRTAEDARRPLYVVALVCAVASAIAVVVAVGPVPALLLILPRLGAVGVVLTAAVLGSVLWRGWFVAVDRVRLSVSRALPYRAVTLAPLLLVAASLAVAIAGDEPLSALAWLLVAAVALRSKRGPELTVPADPAAERAAADAPPTRR